MQRAKMSRKDTITRLRIAREPNDERVKLEGETR